MAALEDTPGCCSSLVLFHLGGGPDTALKAVWAYHETNRPIILFTDRVSHGNGIKLAAAIKKNKLGSVVGCAPRKGNHHVPVKGWAWSCNFTALDKYAKMKKWRRYEGAW